MIGGGAALAAVVIALSLGSGGDGQLATGPYPSSGDDPAARLTNLDSTRGQIWGSATEAFAEHPLTGTGAGTFGLWWSRDDRGAEEVRDAHSLPLESLAELGLPGFLAIALLLAGLGLAAVRAYLVLDRRGDVAAAAVMLAAAAIFVFQAGFDWLWEFPALVLLGLGGAAVLGSAGATRIRPGVRRGWLRVVLVGIALVAGALEVPGLVAANRLEAAQRVAAAGLDERAIDLADDAVSATPWDAQARALRGSLQLRQGDLEAARADALEAIRLERTNWRHWLLLAQIEVAGGDPDAALVALTELARLRPALELDPAQLLIELSA
jgi:tetratricopeptide (TPR) repeat protein